MGCSFVPALQAFLWSIIAGSNDLGRPRARGEVRGAHPGERRQLDPGERQEVRGVLSRKTTRELWRPLLRLASEASESWLDEITNRWTAA